MKSLNQIKYILIFPAFIWSLFLYGGDITSFNIKYKTKIPSTKSKVIVKLDTKVFNKTISKDFYGTQMRVFSPMPDPAVTKSLKLGAVRMGGNEFDIMNWKHQMVWARGYGYSKTKPMEEVVKIIQEYGSEPIFQVNFMGWMPELEDGNFVLRNTATSEFAGETIKHFNGELKLNIKHFCIGNEGTIWHGTHEGAWPDKENPLTGDQYIDRFIEYSLAMRKAQEEVSGNPNDIKIWGPEISNSWDDWNSANFAKDCEWGDIKGQLSCSYGDGKFTNFFEYFFYRLALAEKDPVKNPKKYKLLDYASFHYYPLYRTDINDVTSIIVDSNGKQRVWDMLDSTRMFYDKTWINTIDRSSYYDKSPNILNRITEWKNKYYPEAKVALSEFALDSDGLATNYHPIIRPLFMADLIGILAESEVAHFTRAFLNSDKDVKIPWSLVEDGKRTDLFVLYSLFTNNFLGKLLPVTHEFGNSVKAYATYEEIEKDNGYINLFLINREPSTRLGSIALQVNRETPKEILDYQLPAWSVSYIKIPNRLGDKSMIKVQEFGAKEMKIEIDPYYESKK